MKILGDMGYYDFPGESSCKCNSCENYKPKDVITIKIEIDEN